MFDRRSRCRVYDNSDQRGGEAARHNLSVVRWQHRGLGPSRSYASHRKDESQNERDRSSHENHIRYLTP